jgi:hypothetical protein
MPMPGAILAIPEEQLHSMRACGGGPQRVRGGILTVDVAAMLELRCRLLSPSITAINQPKLSSRGALLVIWDAEGKWGRWIALEEDRCFPRGNAPSCATQRVVVVEEKLLWGMWEKHTKPTRLCVEGSGQEKQKRGYISAAIRPISKRELKSHYKSLKVTSDRKEGQKKLPTSVLASRPIADPLSQRKLSTQT